MDKKKEKEEVFKEKATTLGSFQFYPHQSKLVKKAIEIGLSKKECELLEIFCCQYESSCKKRRTY